VSGIRTRIVVLAGLHGAGLLARGRPEGLAFVERTPEGAARSFWAAVLCLPVFLVLRAFAWASLGEPAGGVARGLAVEIIGYAVAWSGYALVSLPLARALGRAALWPRFIAAWNWANAVQYLVLLVLTVPALVGLPAVLVQGLGLAALGYAVWLEWFVARHALRLPTLGAGLFVLLDLGFGIGLGWVVNGLAGG